MFFVDVVHSSAVLLDPDSTKNEVLTKMLRDVSSTKRDFSITFERRRHALCDAGSDIR